MTALASPPAFTAVLFGLSGCLVDFGARSTSVALQRLYPQHGDKHTTLEHLLGRTATTEEHQAYEQTLIEAASEHAEATPGAVEMLEQLHEHQVPCAWLDELPRDASVCLASVLPSWLIAADAQTCRPWPAPDTCWQALRGLRVEQLDGCVRLVSTPAS